MTGTRIGTLREEDGRGVVRMEDRFATDTADLWAALTDPSRLARWIAVLDGEPRLGGTVRARFTSTWEGTLRVDECEPGRRLLVTSTSDDPEDGETVIEAVISADGTGTRLVIEERGLPLPSIADHGAGWQAHVEDLRALLEGRPAADWPERWSALAPDYRELAAGLGRPAPSR